MATVTFSADEFREFYPEFTSMTDARLGNYFAQAEMHPPGNANDSVVSDINQRKVILYALTAHIAALSLRHGNPVVGQINSASEGTVSVGSVSLPMTMNSAWYAQTQYGLSYWAMTAPLRQMRYVAGRSRPNVLNPWR